MFNQRLISHPELLNPLANWRVATLPRSDTDGNMKIKRNFEILTITKRRLVISQSPPAKQTACAQCGEPMLTIAQAAVLLGIKQSRIFQIVETGTAHFTEAEIGALMICLTSLTNFLEANERK